MSKLGKNYIITKRLEYQSWKWCLLVSGPKGSQKITINDKLFSSKINDKMNFRLHQIKKLKIHLFCGELIEA